MRWTRVLMSFCAAWASFHDMRDLFFVFFDYGCGSFHPGSRRLLKYRATDEEPSPEQFWRIPDSVGSAPQDRVIHRRDAERQLPCLYASSAALRWASINDIDVCPHRCDSLPLASAPGRIGTGRAPKPSGTHLFRSIPRLTPRAIPWPPSHCFLRVPVMAAPADSLSISVAP